MKKNTFIIILAVLSGIFSGWMYGTHIVNGLMKGEIGFTTFIFLPSKNIIDTYVMINSKNELKRLEGYYAYHESGLKDIDFLLTRYKIEDSELLKKTIIWIVEDNNYTNELQNYYKKLYNESPESLKKYLQNKIDRHTLLEENKQY